MDTPRFLTTDEAADLVRMTPNTLRKMRCSGRGPRYSKAGSRCLYSLASILAWLASSERASTSDKPEGAADGMR